MPAAAPHAGGDQVTPPRRHHYVPASYLQGFTPSGTRGDYLWVHDYEEKKSFRSKPDSIGYSRDLYRFRSNPETDMDMDIEEALSKVDADGARVIAKLEKEVGEPGFDGAPAGFALSETEQLILLHYACIMYLRNPAFRRSLAAFIGNQATLEAKLRAWSLSGPEEFEKELGQAGVALLPEVDAGRLIEWMKSPDFRVEIDDPDWLLVYSFLPEVEILQLLAERNWDVWVVAEEAGHFITSDRPLVLTWQKSHPAGVRPGFAHRDTHVFFPLTKHLLLYGSDRAENALIEAGQTRVGVANNVMVSTNDRFIYSPEESFPERRAGALVDSPGADFLREPIW